MVSDYNAHGKDDLICTEAQDSNTLITIRTFQGSTLLQIFTSIISYSLPFGEDDSNLLTSLLTFMGGYALDLRPVN